MVSLATTANNAAKNRMEAPINSRRKANHLQSKETGIVQLSIKPGKCKSLRKLLLSCGCLRFKLFPREMPRSQNSKSSNPIHILAERRVKPFQVARTSFPGARARQTSYPRGKQNKYGGGLPCSRKVILPFLRRKLCLRRLYHQESS